MSDHCQRFELGDVTLAVERTGAGAPVFVLHGFTGDADSMRGIGEALGSHFEVLFVELVGHGRSDAPRALPSYSMPACVDQLVRLGDALGISRAHWLGYSMGGRAALSLAAAAPERVASLLLVGASAGLSDPEVRRERIASDEALADRIEREGLEAFVDHWMGLPLFASQKRLGSEVLECARAQRLRNREHGLANSLRGMGSGAMTPLQDRLATLDVPVALVVGDEDAKFRAIAADLAARLPRARIELVAEAGHAAHLEQPDAFAAIARRFFHGIPL